MAPPKNSPYQLIVEGPTDQYSVIQLLARRGYPWDDETKLRPRVEAAGSDSRALDDFEGKIKGRAYLRIGLILDIDGGATIRSRLDAVRQRVKSTGVDVNPEAIVPGRHFDIGVRSKAGLWFMPDNRSSGALEEFLFPLVPREDGLWQWAPEVVEEAIRHGAPVENKRLKSRFHSWLAWQREPGLPFGLALQSGLLDANHSAVDTFVAWFLELFPPDLPTS